MTLSKSDVDLPPFPRDGVNVHCLRLARICQLKNIPEAQVADIIKRHAQGNLRAGRTLGDDEVFRAVSRAYGSPIQPGSGRGTSSKKPKWPEFDQDAAARVVADIGATVAAIEGASPIKLSTFARGQAGVAEYLAWNLFPGDPWICVGKSMRKFMTLRKSRFGFDPLDRQRHRIALHEFSLLVPSPMVAKWGRTQDSKRSQHTLEATGRRRFIVAEFDGEPDKDRQASLIVELARSMPLVLAVESGGKSLHSWFYVADKARDHIRRWFDYAVTLGADRALWTRSQFARLPGGTRHKPGDPTDGAFQRPFFFNPSAMGGTK